MSRLVESYLDSKVGLWSPTTVKSVRAKLHTLFIVESFDPKQVYDFLVDQKRSPYTIKVYFSIYSQFEKEMVKSNEFEKFVKANRTMFANSYRERTLSLSDEQYTHILNKAKEVNPYLYNLCLLMGSRGLRLAEALEAKWSQVDIQGRLVIIGKGGKQRLVPVSGLSLLKTGHADSQDMKIVGSLSSSTLIRQFFKQFKPVTPHALRSYFATKASKKLDPFEVARLLGHARLETTLRYIRSDFTEIERKLG